MTKKCHPYSYESLDHDDDEITTTLRQLSFRTRRRRNSVDRAAPCKHDSSSESWIHRDELDLCVKRDRINTAQDNSTIHNMPTIPTETHYFNVLSAWPDQNDESSSSSEDESMIYATKYRPQDPKQTKRLDSSCSSFDTTQTEEETSTYSSFEETKTVRWNTAKLETTCLYECQDPYTIRIVILLLLNNGMECPPEENFEFLHCEYTCTDRLKTGHVLSQISTLVDANERPFDRLFHDELEMIHAMAIQDYNLIDGESILVATRTGQQDVSIIREQAKLLLKDRMLLAELRKARIAGRSLQTLSSHDRQDTMVCKQQPSMELAAVVSFREEATADEAIAHS